MAVVVVAAVVNLESIVREEEGENKKKDSHIDSPQPIGGRG